MKRQNNKSQTKTTTRVVTTQAPAKANNSRKPRNNKPKQKVPKVQLSQCAQDYARALINPFTGPEACVPSFPALMSRRSRVFSRGEFSTGTNQIGSICVTPQLAACSDGVCGFFSISTYTGTSMAVNSGTTGVVAINSNSDYVSGQIGVDDNQVQYRVVASGLRIRYTGTNLNRGGQIYALHEPTHDSLDSVTIQSIGNEVEMKKFPVTDNRWTTVLYRPTEVQSFLGTRIGGETGFTTATQLATNQSVGLGGITLSSNYMGFLVKSPDPTLTSNFEYEFFTLFEFTGRNVRGLKPSHVDPVGFNAVHATIALSDHRHPFQGDASTKEQGFLAQVLHYAATGLTWVLDNVGTIAATAAGIVAAF